MKALLCGLALTLPLLVGQGCPGVTGPDSGVAKLETVTLAAIVPAAAPAPAAAVAVVQTPLAGSTLPQFVDHLPVLSVDADPVLPATVARIDTIVDNGTEIELHMREFQAKMMPSTWIPAAGTYTGTWVFGYLNGAAVPSAARETFTGPVIVATRNVPTQVRFVNNLGNTATSNVLAFVNSTDQTLHWADPLNGEANMCNHMIMPMMPPGMGCDQHYSGPIPAVPHLHGGYVPPVLDGGPDAWFTSDGAHHGHGYYTHPGVAAAGNECVYRYPNFQEAAPVWFHDHLLGGTRLNVYAGLAGAYAIIDPALVFPAGLHPLGLQQTPTTPSTPVDFLKPLVIQDRMFDVNGQLFFPNVGINPEHPYWIPEFLGDTICVNGKVWPFLNVQAKRYRFLIINGSNARPYELSIPQGPAIWQIGTDGGFLDAPVPIAGKLVLLPGERADIIIDFAGFGGKTLVMTNTAPAPYPGGTNASPQTVGRIIQFRVAAGAVTDTSFNPASPTQLRPAIVRLPGTPLGPAIVTTPGPTQNVQKTRQLTLNEVMGMKLKIGKIKYPGGPLEILVNNTKWDGKQPGGVVRPDFTPVNLNGITDYYSEMPAEGTTEVWEIINLTADTHPMHTHLVQCQLVNRQAFDAKKYAAAYAAAFPGSATIIDPATGLPYAPGVFIPGFGPPLNYNTGNPLALGGNPDPTLFLLGAPVPPAANEDGWKDTMQCPPGTITRFVARFAPQDTPVVPANPADLNFPFDPNALGYGYVWHCHIVDHEDNEMMRPYAVTSSGATRAVVQGVDY